MLLFKRAITANADDARTAAEEAKEDAAEAAQDAANAVGEAQAAANRLDQWAADGVISPTEKQSLKDEIVRIDADYDEINEGYSRYNLGTPSSYNSAYNSYRSVLLTLSASSPETIPIPSYFESRQSSYYAQRTNALNAIAQAAKNNVDNVGDTVKNEVIVEIGDTIETTVRKEVTNQTETFMEETESKFRQTDEEISAALKRITTTEQDIKTANGTISTLRSEVSNVSQQMTADGIFSIVGSKVTEVAQEKANAAESNAKSDAANKYATTTTVTNMQSSINHLSDQISLTSSKVTTVQNELGNLEERVNSAELKITPNAIVSTVSSNLQIGGRNLLRNSDFSQGWKYWTQNSASGSFKSDTTYGSYLEFSTPAAGDNDVNRIYYLNAIKSRVTYAISFLAKASTSVLVRFGQVDSTNTMADFQIQTAWKRYSAVFTPATAGALSVLIGTANVKLSLTQVKLEEGNIPTDWSPAPEDTPTATEFESSINQLKDQISLTSSKVTTVQDELGNLEERVSSAELQITPDRIISTVSSNLKVSYSNMMEMTGNFGDSIPSTLINNGGGIALDTSVKYEGYNTIKTNVGNGICYSKVMTLEKDTEYCYSAMVKGSKSYTAGANGFLHTQSYNSSGVNIGVNEVKSSITLVENQWTLVYKVFKLYGASTGTIRPFIYASSYGGTVNIAFMCLSKGNVPMFAYDSAPQEAKSAMVQTPNGFTFYGNTFDIKTSILTTTNLKAVHIETGNITVTNGAKIGGWTVNGANLEVTGDNTAKIRVEPSGTKFLRINSSRSTLLEMRADSRGYVFTHKIH